MLSLPAPLPKSNMRAQLVTAVGYTHTPALKPVLKLLSPCEFTDTEFVAPSKDRAEVSGGRVVILALVANEP